MRWSEKSKTSDDAGRNAAHGGELSANGLQGEKETVFIHERGFAVETNGSTMNLQSTANCVLNVCLSPGCKFKRVGVVCRGRCCGGEDLAAEEESPA